jgi:uncharacterized protein
MRHGAHPDRRRAVKAISALALTSLAGCAYRHSPLTAYTPSLFEIRGAQLPGRMYLFGSIHSGISRFYPLPNRVQEAFNSSNALAVELDMTQRHGEMVERFKAHVWYPPGRSLLDSLGPARFKELREYLREDDNRWAQTIRKRPWAIAITLGSADDQRIGAEREQGLESILIKAARENGKAVLELEDGELQLRAIAQGSDEEQARQLIHRLHQVKNWDRSFAEILEAWRRGDQKWMAQIKDYAYPVATLASLRQRLFSDRDALITRRIEKLLQTNTTIFALVGALHLAGTDSLQNALSEHGLDVSQIRY